MKKRIKRTAHMLIAASLVLGGYLPLPTRDGRFSPSVKAAAGKLALPNAQGDRAVQQLKQQGLYASLEEALDETLYEVRWEAQTALAETPAAYHAPNPAQRLNAYFTLSELRLLPLRTNARQSEAADQAQPSESAEWRAALKLKGYGYGKNLLPLGPAELVTTGNRIEYQRAAAPLTEWYVNKAEGLEQGFTLYAPPGAKPEDARLRLALELTGDLRAELAEAGQAIALQQASGEAVLRYGDLYAYDAAGRALPSQMSVSDGQVWLEVDDASAVYPVTIDPNFTEQQKLTAAPNGRTRDHFGYSIAISGDTVVVGVPYAVIPRGRHDGGAAYVFVRNGAAWSLQQILPPTLARPAGGAFGYAVAINGDAIVVGAPNPSSASLTGTAHLFVRNGNSWSESGEIRNCGGVFSFGYSVAITDSAIFVGAPLAAQGVVYVFPRFSTLLQCSIPLIANDGSADAHFGISLAASHNTLVVGASDDDLGSNSDQGSAYVFVGGGLFWGRQQKLTASDGATDDHFGRSVAISEETIVVGASFANVGTNDNQGAAYVFVRNAGVWSQQQKLTASAGAAGDYFGCAVAISGDTLSAGASGATIGFSSGVGAAYVFTRSGAFWSQQQKLTASDGAGFDYFGSAIAIDLDTVVVGAPYDDIGSNSNQGSAYIFARPCQLPGISSQPSSFAVCGVRPATFSVTATGSITGYQWRKNGTPLGNNGGTSGVTSPTLTINAASAGDAGAYDVVISSPCGSVTSTAASLTVYNYTLSPLSARFTAGDGPGAVSVSVGGGCGWTATSNASWLRVTLSSSGSGNGTVLYYVSANTSTSSRTGTLTIAGRTFTVTQTGSVRLP